MREENVAHQIGGMRHLSEEDKEQQARIALLDYFGSLARHWATVLLATVVAFYSVWQIRGYIYDWVFTFALTITIAGGAYAFLRMITHGKYCELALDPKVLPRGCGTCVSQMLHGMLHDFRTEESIIKWRKYEKRVRWGKCLDNLGGFKGFLCWTLGSVCIWFFFAAVASFDFSLMGSLQKVITQLLKWPSNALVLLAAVVILLGLGYGFTRIRPETFQNEIERRET